jgi:fructose-1,6-bisphosphatase/inositol monophosphatase family enzyme
VDPEALLALFTAAADAARDAVAALSENDRHRRTTRPGQYHLDLVADAAVLDVLHRTSVAVVSEESGRTGVAGAPITLVLDPVDGSTNCSRGIPYWAISVCALDADGLLCGLVRNQVTGATTTAIRGEGAWRDGERLVPSTIRRLDEAIIGFAALPTRPVGSWQLRAFGSAALELCDVAAGTLDGYVNGADALAPWDYLGGLLVCREAGAVAADAVGRELAVADPDARRQVLAAGTAELLDALRTAVTVS